MPPTVHLLVSPLLCLYYRLKLTACAQAPLLRLHCLALSVQRGGGGTAKKLTAADRFAAPSDGQAASDRNKNSIKSVVSAARTYGLWSRLRYSGDDNSDEHIPHNLSTLERAKRFTEFASEVSHLCCRLSSKVLQL